MAFPEFGFAPENFILPTLGFSANIKDLWRFLKGESVGDDEEKTTEKARHPIDTDTFLKVRDSVCVAGYHWETVNSIKRSVGSLLPDPFPIEGFHVKCTADLKDGALLVPKVILVAKHSPGLKLLDGDEDRGQLDHIYDEVCQVEAELLIIYTGLPKAIYKPMRHMVYHPKMADTVFPYQPVLKSLAAENCFITIIENSELSDMQKNVIREWLTKPVKEDHPVYRVAEFLSSVELSQRNGAYGSSDQRIQYYKPSATSFEFDPYNDITGFQPATEEHPLAEKKKKKRKKEKKEKRYKSVKTRHKDLVTLEEATVEPDDGVELNTMKYSFVNKRQAYDEFV